MSKTIFKGKTTDGIPYLIRYPKRTDLQELWKYINELSKEQTFISVQGEEVTLEQERKWLNEQLKNIPQHTTLQLLVEIDKKIVGVSGVNMSKVTHGSHVGIFGISIAKDFRNQGIGKILMEKVMEEAKRVLPKLKILVLGVFSNNPVARNLYEGFGFKEYGRLPGGILHRGKYIDDIKMYYEIKP